MNTAGSISDVTLAADSKTINDLANKYLTGLLVNYQFSEFEKAAKLICFLDAFQCPHEQVCLRTLLILGRNFVSFVWIRKRYPAYLPKRTVRIYISFHLPKVILQKK